MSQKSEFERSLSKRCSQPLCIPSAFYEVRCPPSLSRRRSDFRCAAIRSKFYSRSHDAVIRVYDDAGNVIETHEHTGEFKEW
jgi:hypothetical protein